MRSTITHLCITWGSFCGAVPFLSPTPLNEKRATRAEALTALTAPRFPVTKRKAGSPYDAR